MRSIMLVLILSGCASVSPLPSSGPEQRTGQAVYNPNCVAMCSAKAVQQTADKNSAPVTAGDVSQSSEKSAKIDDGGL